jgi:hypothetical protein
VLNVAVPRVRLQGAGIVTGIGEPEAAGVAKHVGVRLEIEAGFGTGPLDHLCEAGRGERRAALDVIPLGDPRDLHRLPLSASSQCWNASLV